MGGILVSCYLLIIISCLKGRSCLKYVRCLSRYKYIRCFSLLAKLKAYITKSNTPGWLFLIFWLNFQTVLSFACFSHELLVHVNENVSFHRVEFLHLIRYGNFTINASIKSTFIFAIIKEDFIFFSQFSLIFNVKSSAWQIFKSALLYL